MPVRSGLGARLGLNLGYLKFTPELTWNPFLTRARRRNAGAPFRRAPFRRAPFK